MAVAASGSTIDGKRVADVLGRLRRERRIRFDGVEAAALAAAVDGLPADRVELFGSRVDPAARGGDIDLLVFSRADGLEVSRTVSCRFFAGCESRIDVVVVDPRATTAAQQAFLKTLRRIVLA